jgi:peroxiredoxin
MTATAAPAQPPAFRNLLPGDPAPHFRQRSTGNPSYAFDTVAGRYVLLCFYGTAGDEAGRSRLAAVEADRALFDDETLCFFGVSVDPADDAQGRLREILPGVRHFHDHDRTASQLYGASALEGDGGAFRRFWAVLDPMLRVRARCSRSGRTAATARRSSPVCAHSRRSRPSRGSRFPLRSWCCRTSSSRISAAT